MPGGTPPPLFAVLEILPKDHHREENPEDLKEEVKVRLVPVYVQIDALKEEAGGLGRTREWAREREQNECAVLKRLETMAPEVMDSLQGSERRQAYAHLDLKVVAQRDKSLIITWFVDQDIRRIWCPSGRTSTR